MKKEVGLKRGGKRGGFSIRQRRNTGGITTKKGALEKGTTGKVTAKSREKPFQGGKERRFTGLVAKRGG